MRPRAKKLFWNAMLLTLASLLMRTVGVSFGVVVSGRVGAEAMGLFSLLSGVYGFALTLATSGIHLGVTRMTVEAMESGNPLRVAGILRRATVYAICFGKLVLFPLFAFFAVKFLPLPYAFKASVLILSATPCASVVFNIAEMHNCDAELSANCVLLSTLMCFLTIPPLVLLL